MQSARSLRDFRVLVPVRLRVVVLLQQAREQQWLAVAGFASPAVAEAASPAVGALRVPAAPSRIPSARAIALQNYNAATWDEIEPCG